VTVLALPAPAFAATGGGTSPGGSGAPADQSQQQAGSTQSATPPRTRPSVSLLSCVSRCAGARAASTGGTVTVQPKGILRVSGRNLAQVRSMVFTGVAGPDDDVRARVRRATDTAVTFRAPAQAPTGPLQAVDVSGAASRPTRVSVAVSAPTPAPAPSPTPAPAATATGALDPVLATGHVFPIQGAHQFAGADGRFGAARSGHVHQGQDVPAACGTPLVAARGGTVKANTSQAAAGNYVVIAGDTGYDYVYMHLRDPALPAKGVQVSTGQPIGYVGETGDATGCHLHFELWAAPGWYTGGAPFDPLPALLAWDGKTQP
jgi:murein DD-endopeptidase MepM/ murein hydrolase activator NlpD